MNLGTSHLKLSSESFSSSIRKLTVTGFKTLSSIEPKILQYFPDLQTLCLANNAFERIEFSSLDHLNTLEKSLDTLCFDNLQPGVESRLEVLDLSGNQLSCISKQTLSNLPPSLVKINLSKNKIVDIESGAFRDLASLRSLHLACNQFETLDLNNILDTVNLWFLDLQGNANFPIMWHESSQQKEEEGANMIIKRDKSQEISNLSVVNCSRIKVSVKVSSGRQREANLVVLNKMAERGIISVIVVD
jgi:Leucine-rich repeat (LRR) protein